MFSHASLPGNISGRPATCLGSEARVKLLEAGCPGFRVFMVFRVFRVFRDFRVFRVFRV